MCMISTSSLEMQPNKDQQIRKLNLTHFFSRVLLLWSLKEAYENAKLFHLLVLLQGSSSGWLPNKMHWLLINSVLREGCGDQNSRINSKLSEKLPSHNESDQVRNVINLIRIDFVWILSFICIFIKSHGIIFFFLPPSVLKLRKGQSTDRGNNKFAYN